MTSPRQEPLAYERVSCPLCGVTETEPRFRIPNRTRAGIYVNSVFYPIAPVHDIVRCRQCGLLFASPRLARRNDRGTYSGAEEAAYFADTRRDREAGNEAMLDTLERLGARGRLLDAGCGDGLLLAQAAARGWESCGVERSRTLAEHVRRAGGVPSVILGDVARLPFPPCTFDAVSLINVLEHVPNPAVAIKEATRVTRPHGVVAVHTPNAGGLAARVCGARWHHYDPVEHLFYFTRRTLQIALERQGLAVIGTLELPGAPVAKRVLLSLSQRLGLSLSNGLGLVARKRPTVAEGG